MKIIKLAIIGTGGRANSHAGHFIKDKGCRLTAACDLDGKRAGLHLHR